MNSLFYLRMALGTSRSTVTLEAPNTNLLALSPAIPFAIAANWFGFGEILVFFWSLLGLAFLTERENFLIEQVAYHTAPTAGGFLIAIFREALEFIIAIFAIYNQKIEVVKYFLLGSIYFNLAIVFTASIYHGDIAKLKKLQKYDKRANANSKMLLAALVWFFLPMPLKNVGAAIVRTEDQPLPLLLVGSIIMLIIHLVNFVFQQGMTNNQSPEAIVVCIHELPQTRVVRNIETNVIGLWSGILWLAIAIALMALLSKYVVETIEIVADAWVFPLPVKFLSMILLPMVGYAAKHNGAITSPFKNKMPDISLGVNLSSAAQIFTLVVPLCVIIAWLRCIEMELIKFNLLETVLLTFTIVATAIPILGWIPSFLLGRASNGLSLQYSLSLPIQLHA